MQALGPLTQLLGADPAPLASSTDRRRHLLSPCADDDAVRAVLAPMAWVRPAPAPGASAPAAVRPLSADPSVRNLTALLEHAAGVARHRRILAYVRLAVDTPTLSPSARPVAGFRSTLADIWRARIDNRFKEPLWRLANDAIPGARFRNWTCPCGAAAAPTSARCHSFWECAVARAVLAQLADPRLPGGAAPAVLRANVWLLTRPPGWEGQLQQWQRIGLATLSAMEHGRRVLWARSRAEASQQAVTAAANLAAARFWVVLADLDLV
jgi:hypothetical protein